MFCISKYIRNIFETILKIKNWWPKNWFFQVKKFLWFGSVHAIYCVSWVNYWPKIWKKMTKILWLRLRILISRSRTRKSSSSLSSCFLDKTLYIKTLASGLENKFHCTQWLLLLRGGKIPVKLTKKQVNWKSVVKNWKLIHSPGILTFKSKQVWYRSNGSNLIKVWATRL